MRDAGQPSGCNDAETLNFSSYDLGQCCPHHYPHRRDFDEIADDPLGAPMTVGEIAALLRCSIWTVRQRYLRSGLPHFRLGRNGKLVFYRRQVLAWILERQKKELNQLVTAAEHQHERG